jgi:hypothetical protein
VRARYPEPSGTPELEPVSMRSICMKCERLSTAPATPATNARWFLPNGEPAPCTSGAIAGWVSKDALSAIPLFAAADELSGMLRVPVAGRHWSYFSRPCPVRGIISDSPSAPPRKNTWMRTGAACSAARACRPGNNAVAAKPVEAARTKLLRERIVVMVVAHFRRNEGVVRMP